jgi:very-short-patch-repair endonuclease
MRSLVLERQGLTILRFRDHQVLQDMESVLAVILEIAQVRTLIISTPLPGGEGL